MVTYPISIAKSNYRGSNPKKRVMEMEKNRISIKLENYINDMLLKQELPIQSYSYHEIASETGVSLEVVRDLCFSIDCGHTGFTAIKHGLTYEQAVEQSTNGI